MTSVASSPDSEHRSVKIFSSHDPACDQCRIKKIGCGRELPACSNCVKAGVECVRSNKGKRPNQTNKLVNDFEQFGNRLGSLEKNVLLIHKRLDEFLKGLPGQQHDTPTDDGQDSRRRATLAPASAMHKAIVTSPMGCEDFAPPDDDMSPDAIGSTQHFSGGSSLMSLFEDADEKINKNLEAFRPKASVRDILARSQRPQPSPPPPPLLDGFMAFKAEVYQGLSLSAHAFHLDLSNDGAALQLPPRRLLEPIIEPYFRHVAPVTPVVARKPCVEAIDRHYSSEASDQDLEPAWIILFNYMILVCFVGQYMPLERPSSDLDIVSVTQFEKPFIVNVRRAFSGLDRLLAPKLVNLQALVALTYISQKYFSEHVTQYLLNQACFVGKALGLHRRYSREQLTADEHDERRRVFWCLFITDKDVSLLLGTPPNLHHYDCDVTYPRQITHDFRRRIDSSLILGKVYILLYSPAASRTLAQKLEDSIDELLDDIDGFQRNVEDVASNETDLNRRAWQYLMLEQTHTLHHARVMVLRRSSRPALYELRLAEARQAIQTMARVHVARTTVGGFMVLRRPFQWRPFVSFFELLPKIFTYPIMNEQLSDLTLLQELVDVLRIVAPADGPFSYCGKLLRIAAGCVAIASEFSQLCLRHQNVDSTRLTQTVTSPESHRKRKTSPAGIPGSAQASKIRSAGPHGQHHAEHGVSNAEHGVSIPLVGGHVIGPSPMVSTGLPTEFTPPADAMGISGTGFDMFEGNSLTDMFPGWPRANSDNLSFLSEGFFWGDDDGFNSRQA